MLLFFILYFALDAHATSFPKLEVPRNSLVEKVILEGNEVCPTTKVKAQSEADIVRKHTVRIRVKGDHRCTGVPIERNMVLLASHCFGPKEDLKEFSVEVFSENSYQTYRVVQSTRSTSQTKDDLAILRLDRLLPSENVIQPLSGKCSDRNLLQGGFGITEEMRAAPCVKYAHYTRQKPRYVPGFNLPLAFDVTFYATPKLEGAEQGLACNGDSGGPVFCKSGSKWALAGIFTGVAPKDTLDKKWSVPRKICEDYEHPDRLAYCVESCRQSHAIVGFELNQALDTISDMKAYLKPVERQSIGTEEGLPSGSGF